jgi:tetratricopeptide (TPR) repeat protein
MNRRQRRAAAKRGKDSGVDPAAGRHPPTAQVFATAFEHHQAGRLAQAERLCERILSIDPNHVHSLHLLGLVAYRRGLRDVAIERIGKAIAVNDSLPEFHHNLGNILREEGRPEEAASCYRRTLSLKPDSVDTLYNLGNVLQDLGQLEQAVAYFQQAVTLKPDSVAIHNNLGAALQDQGRLHRAIASYERALALEPGSVETLANLASAFRDEGKLDRAVAHYERALCLKQDHIESLNGIGVTLRDQGRLDEAMAHFKRALALRPDYAETYNNLGNVLEDQGRLAEAVAHFERALALRPGYAETHNNLGNALEPLGRLDEAMACYERALALRPEYAEARFNRSLLLLLRGDYKRGWAEYEWRWLCKDVARNARNFGRPKWSGEAVDGKIILLHAEQGFGDAIKFFRYVPAVAERGARVVLEVPNPLIRLAANIPGVSAALVQGDSLPEFDLHCPLLSLPRAFDTRLETIPDSVPYLVPPADASAAWAQRLSNCSGLKVGLVWSGNPENRHNPSRSMALSELEPLWSVAGVCWYSLQVGERAGDIALACTPWIADLSPFLTDFAETAAAICHLDLVITVETAVAHLAGALGRRVWVPLPLVPAWHWLLERDDCPWYPTMRLFRRTSPADWKSVIGAIAEGLARMVNERRATADAVGLMGESGRVGRERGDCAQH